MKAFGCDVQGLTGSAEALLWPTNGDSKELLRCLSVLSAQVFTATLRVSRSLILSHRN